MTRHKTTYRVTGTSLAIVLALALGSPVQAQATKPADKTTMTEAVMMDHCKDMKAQKQKMNDEMKAQDEELTARVARMNSAPQDQKLGLMAAIVTQMVEQRTANNVRHAEMEAAMMQHMMQHMEMGKASMPKCPMMKDMKDLKAMKGTSGKSARAY